MKKKQALDYSFNDLMMMTKDEFSDWEKRMIKITIELRKYNLSLRKDSEDMFNEVMINRVEGICQKSKTF